MGSAFFSLAHNATAGKNGDKAATPPRFAGNGQARLVRDSVLVWEGPVGSLRRVKDDVREVGTGFECGIKLADRSDELLEGDIIEFYEKQRVR